ncbi:MAG: CPBP family glutamic-type intramembrane protease, partial [Planctomycetaceae bacterium]
NGADYWMRGALSAVGLGHSLLLPVMLMFVLFAWHVLARDPWRVKPATIGGMMAESLVFACCLVAIGQIHNAVFSALPDVKELSVTAAPPSARVIAFIGAGVYEEVLFRLCLVPAAYGLFRLVEVPHRWAAIGSILVTSVVFAVAHYVGPAADSFTLFSFSFRTIAGVFFAALFVVRGFGITVGAHAAYDLLVGVLFASN